MIKHIFKGVFRVSVSRLLIIHMHCIPYKLYNKLSKTYRGGLVVVELVDEDVRVLSRYKVRLMMGTPDRCH